MVLKTPYFFSWAIFKSPIFLLNPHRTLLIAFWVKKWYCIKKFYDLGWAIRVYGLGYGIQDNIKFFSRVIFKSPSLSSETRIGHYKNHFCVKKRCCTKKVLWSWMGHKSLWPRIWYPRHHRKKKFLLMANGNYDMFVVLRGPKDVIDHL